MGLRYDELSREPISKARLQSSGKRSMAFMFRKGDPAFKKLVDSEVARIIAQGEINGVYKKWFESPIPPNQVNLKLPMPYMMRDSFRTPTDWVPE